MAACRRSDRKVYKQTRTMKLSILQTALLLLSVNLHSVFSQTSCTTMVFSQIPGQQFTTLAAGDKLVGTNVGACQASCHSDLACIGFDLRTTLGATAECFRNTDRTKTVGTSNPGNFDHYRKVIDCYSHDRTRKCTPVQRYVGLKNMAGQITAGSATSEAHCGQLCVANQLCKAFGWDDNAKDCKISTTLVVNSSPGTYKTFDGGYPNPSTCQAFIDPVRLITTAQLGSCTGSYVRTANRQYQTGMGTVPPVATETLCQQACDANINCFGFNWNTVNKQCYLLFDTRSVYVAISDWDFYQKRYTCQSAAANEECLYDAMGTYAPVLLSSLRSASPQSTATLEQCSQFLENYQTTARKGILFNPGSSACYLFTATGASPFDTLAMAAPGEASFKYLHCQPKLTPSGNICKTAYTPVGNSKLNNAVGLRGNPNSLAGCEAACTALTSCLAYHFGNNICGATTTVSLILPRLQTTADANYKTYVRQQKCLRCNYQRVVDRSGAGAQMYQPNFKTEISCLEACVKSSTRCKAIEFNPVTQGCFHFSTATEYNTLLGSKNVYIYQASCDACVPSYTREAGKTQGGPSTAHRPETEDSCKTRCNNSPTCIAANYYIGTQTCYLYTSRQTATIASQQFIYLTKVFYCDGGSVISPAVGRGNFRTGCFYSAQSCKGVITKPTVERIYPTVGPVAGGTEVSVTGQHFDLFPVENLVIDATIYCDIIRSDSTYIAALTPSVGENMVERPLSVTLVFAGGLEIHTDSLFTYKGNPQISSIHPNETIIDGGTTVTVTGQSLDSVAQPRIEVTMVYRRTWKAESGADASNETKTLFDEGCTVNSNTTVICVTPALEIPPEFLEEEGEGSENRSTTGKPPSRGAINYKTDEAELSFFLGFKMDGDKSFKNLSKNPDLARYGRLDVYGTFVITPFSNDGTISFWPGINQTLDITGTDMDRGCTKDDYSIDIGAGICKVVALFSNVVVCEPPAKQPDPGPVVHPKGLLVVVNVGEKYSTDVGYVRYQYGPSSMTWIILGASLGGLLVCGAAVAAIVVHRRKRTSAEPPDPVHLEPQKD